MEPMDNLPKPKTQFLIVINKNDNTEKGMKPNVSTQ